MVLPDEELLRLCVWPYRNNTAYLNGKVSQKTKSSPRIIGAYHPYGTTLSAFTRLCSLRVKRHYIAKFCRIYSLWVKQR